MSKTAKLSIGEVLTNRKTGETFTVKELTDTVAVLNNNKGYKLTSIMKTFKKATEVITDVNIDTDKMDKAAEPVKVITISRNAIIKAFESKYCKWTVDMPKQEEAEREPAIAQDEPTAPAPTTAPTTAPKQEAEKKEEKKATAKTTAKDLSALRAQLLGMASEYFTLEEKTQYTSVKAGKKCVMEIYKGKRAFQVAISNKYLFEDYIILADSIKKFPNDCYYRVTEKSFRRVKEIVADALENIKDAFPDKVNNNSISTQQSIIENDTTAIAEE